MKILLVAVVVVFSVAITSCDNHVSYANINTNNNNQGSDNEQFNTNENTDNEIIVNNHLDLLRGTTWNASRGSHIIEFSSTHSNQVLFRNHQNFGNGGGNLNTIVTHGAFRLHSYDGEILKLINGGGSEGQVVSISVILYNNTLTVNGLGHLSFRPPNPPFSSLRNFSHWNGVYTRAE